MDMGRLRQRYHFLLLYGMAWFGLVPLVWYGMVWFGKVWAQLEAEGLMGPKNWAGKERRRGRRQKRDGYGKTETKVSLSIFGAQIFERWY